MKNSMEIKRNFEELAIIKRRFVIRQTPSNQQIACSKCGEAMVFTEKAANLLIVKQHNIFRLSKRGRFILQKRKIEQ